MPGTLLQTAGVRIGGLSKELSVPTGRIGRVSTQAAERCAAEESETSAVINLGWFAHGLDPGRVSFYTAWTPSGHKPPNGIYGMCRSGKVTPA